MPDTSAVLNEAAPDADESLKTETPKPDAESPEFLNLKAKLSNAFKERDEAKKLAKQFEGLDPDEIRQILADRQKAEQEALKKDGDFDKFKAQLEERHTLELGKVSAEVQAANERAERIVDSLFLQKLEKMALDQGVKQTQLLGAIAEGHFAEIFALDEQTYQIYKKDGIGDSKEMELIWHEFRTKHPDYFNPTIPAGTGALGSSGGSGNSKVMSRTKFETLEPAEQMAFATSGGKLTD